MKKWLQPNSKDNAMEIVQFSSLLNKSTLGVVSNAKNHQTTKKFKENDSGSKQLSQSVSTEPNYNYKNSPH